MIGYYAHHHGSGHLHRATSVARHLGGRMTLLSSVGPAGDGIPWVRLARDDEPAPSGDDVTAGGTLHWAPLNHAGLRARSQAIADWSARAGARLIVSDVSVEVLVLSRLLSVPAAAVALRGHRHDRAHALGYDAASRILATWPRDMQHPWPQRWLDKTEWVGALSRFDGRPTISHSCEVPGRCVLLLLGAGGHDVRMGDLRTAGAVPDSHWHVVGRIDDGAARGARTRDDRRVQLLGWVADPWFALCRADIVVATAGDNAVSDVAAARKPLIVLPQARPFDEQVHQAQVLERHGLAEVATRWPDRLEWASLLDRAQLRGGTRWARYHDGHAASRMAERLAELACEGPTRLTAVRRALA